MSAVVPPRRRRHRVVDSGISAKALQPLGQAGDLRPVLPLDGDLKLLHDDGDRRGSVGGRHCIGSTR
eukprot:1180654-Prymnesium_polylepis.1